jgi:hypothetical protein
MTIDLVEVVQRWCAENIQNESKLVMVFKGRKISTISMGVKEPACVMSSLQSRPGNRFAREHLGKDAADGPA